MRNDRRLIELLCCPTCQGSLQLTQADAPTADDHILSGILTCDSCQQEYPIVRGVPRFVVGEYEEVVNETVKGFGFQWQRSAKVLDNHQFAGPETFLDFISPPVSRDYFTGKIVLDAGCGAGRFSRNAAGFGAERVVGIDLSESVEVAFEMTRHYPNVLILQGDIFNIPVRPMFDYAFSIGVLHHTEDPRRAFGSVVKKVKPGGGMSAWVYGCENNGWIINVLNPIREQVTSRLPRPLLLVLAYVLAVPLFLVLKLVYRPVGNIKTLKGLRRFLFYFDYLYFLGSFGFHTQAYIIFDHLVPELAAYICHDDFADWFHEHSLQNVVITSRAGNSWRGFGTRLEVNR